jgi:hypothetical protein
MLITTLPWSLSLARWIQSPSSTLHLFNTH